ncbi:MAG: lipid-A-disaccharide synthase [Candidatus Omnitrophica bacterium]|nr:lipid-A-disaccharide synthase [Candidatus Omnitrophota bacterium]
MNRSPDPALLTMKNSPENILIIAGEPSGDMRGGELIKELNRYLPDASFWGIGGDHMLEQGVELIEHIRELSIIGVWEAVKNHSRTKAQYAKCVENIRKRKPLAAILIDYPGFNLAIAKHLHAKGIRVIYYIIPQVWAWGRGRTRLLKRYADKLLVLFEFEKRFLEKQGIKAEFVGHPLVDKVPALPAGEKERSGFTVALLPGSRESEIKNLLPIMLDTAEMVHKERDDTNFIVAENSNVDASLYDSTMSGHTGIDIRRVKDNTFQALAASDFAIVASGTATLETAAMERPFIVVYKASPLTAFFYYRCIKIPYLGLVNIIAGKEVAPELIQQDATPGKISKKTLEMINNDTLLGTTKEELRKVKAALGGTGASKRAAEAVRKFIEDTV